jgi:hypothetical protein
MPLEGHWERQNAPLRATTGRERRLLAGFVAVLAAGVVALVVALVSGGGSSAAGCVSVTAPNSMGGAVLRQCGADARQWCAQEVRRGDALAHQVLAQCRRAGYAAR